MPSAKQLPIPFPASFRELNLKAFEKGLEYGITALTATANPADAELQEQYSPE